ncbi:putative GTP-binding protein EngB [Azospirillaceae bacterium]
MSWWEALLSEKSLFYGELLSMSDPFQVIDASQKIVCGSESDEDVESARRFFSGPCDFLWGALTADQLPEATLPEIAFAGRSNVGKSSLVNALTGRRTLARTSNTPGRTQQINFFNLAGRLILVDLPGYGYAQQSKSVVEAWTGLIRLYLKGRVPLRRVCLLVDSRHGLKDLDIAIMKQLDNAAVSYQIVLTKVDKVKPAALESVRGAVGAALIRHAAAFPEVLVSSAETGQGISDLRVCLAAFAVS